MGGPPLLSYLDPESGINKTIPSPDPDSVQRQVYQGRPDVRSGRIGRPEERGVYRGVVGGGTWDSSRSSWNGSVLSTRGSGSGVPEAGSEVRRRMDGEKSRKVRPKGRRGDSLEWSED